MKGRPKGRPFVCAESAERKRRMAAERRPPGDAQGLAARREDAYNKEKAAIAREGAAEPGRRPENRRTI